MERMREIDREIKKVEQITASLNKILAIAELLGAVNNSKAADVEIHNRIKGLIDN